MNYDGISNRTRKSLSVRFRALGVPPCAFSRFTDEALGEFFYREGWFVVIDRKANQIGVVLRKDGRYFENQLKEDPPS